MKYGVRLSLEQEGKQKENTMLKCSTLPGSIKDRAVSHAYFFRATRVTDFNMSSRLNKYNFYAVFYMQPGVGGRLLAETPWLAIFFFVFFFFLLLQFEAVKPGP